MTFNNRVMPFAAHTVFVWLLCLAAVGVSAQMKNAAHFTHAVQPAGPYKVGDVVKLVFTVRIDAGYHVYSSIAPKEDANLPTTFGLDKDSKGVAVAGPLEEQGKRIKKFDEVFGTDVQYFDEQVVFTQPLRITATNAQVRGYISYQVCDANSCVPGTYNVQLDWTAQPAAVAPITQAPKQTQQQTPAVQPADTGKAATLPQAPTTTTTTEAAPPAPAMGNAAMFLQAFLFGLAGLLTPCVFPMIPLTVSYFTKRSGTRAQGIRNALLYGGSIVFIFVVVGLLLTIAFGAGALYNLASNPWLNLVFFAIVVAFGLSFLGLFDITLPGAWSTFIDRHSEKGGVLGIFFMALTLVLVSFSCTGPLVGTLLVSAAGGSYLAPAIGMLGFSLAFALPFGLFAIFPGWLQALPKSGGWLNAVKVTLGFLELALALKFLSNADLVWHWGILDREVYLAAWIVIFSLLGLYFLNKIQLPHDSPRTHVGVPSLVLAIISFWFVVYLIPGLWGAPLKLLSGYLPPVNDDIGVKTAAYAQSQGIVQGPAVCNITDRKYAEKLVKSTPPGFCVFYDLEQGLKYARANNKPVFLDFTGHTCVNCRQMESNVWPDERVRRTLRDEYVMISLFVDDQTPLDSLETLPDGSRLRTIGDKWLRYQQDAFQTNAQPYYVLMDAERNLLAAPRGYDLDKDAYVRFLQMGLSQHGKKPVAAR